LKPIFCSVADAKDATGLSRSTIYTAMAAGRIKWRKYGRRRLVEVASLEQLGQDAGEVL
jgi:hypothetical protein